MTESYPASNQPSGATWSYPPPAPPYSGYGPTDPGASDLPGGPAGGPFGPFGPVDPPGPGGPTGPAGPTEPEQPRSGRSRTIVIAAVTAALVGGGVGAGTVAAVDDNNGNTTVVNGLPQSTQTAPSAAKIDGSISAAAAKIQPSVVTIDVSSQQAQGNGSGVIIRNDGYIVTNDHVVSVAANGGTMTVLTNDGQQAKATIVGRDTSDDLAVIKVSGLKNLTAATFGKSGNLVVGQSVVAVGAPLGLANTVTSGIVSNTARPVRSGDNDQAVFDAIQTDAAINPGNSGGALADLNGNVVGINAAIATPNTGGLQIPGQDTQSGSIGIGFAIPADEVSRIAAQLISTGKATHAVIGVQVASQQNSSQTTAGATLNKVDANSPAAKAGLKAGDVVTRVDTQRIDDADALIAAIRSHAAGEKVSLTYTRAGQSKTVQVTLGSAAN